MMKQCLIPILMVFLAIGGCAKKVTSLAKSPSTTLTTAVADVNTAKETLTSSQKIENTELGKIEQNSSKIHAEASTPVTENIDITPIFARIREYSTSIIASVKAIQIENVKTNAAVAQVQKSIDDVSGQIKNVSKLEVKVSEADIARQEAQLKAQKFLYTILAGAFVIGFGLMVGGAFLFLKNRLNGSLVFSLGTLVMGLSTAATFWLKEFALVSLIGAGVLFLIAIGVIVYSYWKEARAKEIAQTAVSENVDLVNKIKTDLPQEAQIKWFGDVSNTIPPLAQAVQSESTISLVKNLKL
jgi:hypothetical protein